MGLGFESQVPPNNFYYFVQLDSMQHSQNRPPCDSKIQAAMCLSMQIQRSRRPAHHTPESTWAYVMKKVKRGFLLMGQDSTSHPHSWPNTPSIWFIIFFSFYFFNLISNPFLFYLLLVINQLIIFIKKQKNIINTFIIIIYYFVNK